MKAKIGFQEVFLDFLIHAEEKKLVWSIYDRSAINVRSFAASSIHSTISIENQDYICPYGSKEALEGTRYIERFNSGRDVVVSALCVSKTVNEFYLITTKERMESDTYSFLMRKYPFPLKKEWMRYFLNVGVVNNVIQIHSNCVIAENKEQTVDIGFGNVKLSSLICIKFSMTQEYLERIISEGLKGKKIQITDAEVEPLNFKTLDEYYSRYGANIVKNLRTLIHPLTDINGELKTTATRSKRLYPAQANGVNALVARLKKSKYAIVNMDMGTGKTLQALATCDAYYNEKTLSANPKLSLKDIMEQDLVNYKVAVLCPPHLVDKWVSEGKEIANLECIGVKSFSQLLQINENNDLYKKGKHLFVFSKDFAKLGDTLAPIPNKTIKKQAYYRICGSCKDNYDKTVVKGWDTNKCPECGERQWVKVDHSLGKVKGMICPECGEILLKKCANLYLTEALLPEDFDKRKSFNLSCYHCGATLWGSQVKNIGDAKYIWKKYTYYTSKSHKSKTSAWILEKELKNYKRLKNIDDDEIFESNTCGPRKYSPAKYIAKHMKGFFDFFIADECHMYETSSAQGQAFETFVKNSKKTLALTGTLTNGKASGLFYMFWRLDPGKMQKLGYEFYGEQGINKWNSMYGVMEQRTRVTESEYNQSSRGTKQTRENVKPGISPQILKDFLLESVVQLQISDLSEGLPKLTEKIVNVPLEENIKNSLRMVTDKLQSYSKSEKCPAMNMLALQYQLFYSDKPYQMHEIKSPIKRNEIVCEPENYPQYKEMRLLNKEIELCDIVEKELQENRNCYIYVEKTGRETDFFLLERIKSILTKNVAGAKVLTLEANTVAATKRESWFKKQVEDKDYNIIISNPRLVETGIDFVWESNGVVYNFPTLIFYQSGFKLDTLWQASRRAYRLIQKQECRTYYMCSDGTMQLDVLQLMAEKQVSVSAIQGGEFSARGLASMAKGVDPKIELARRLKNGKKANIDEVQNMFKAISLSASNKFSKSIKNLLISDVTSKSCIYGIVNKQNTITMDFIEKFNNFSVIEKKEETKKLRKEDNKERKKKNKKVDLAEGQIGFFDIFKGGF